DPLATSDRPLSYMARELTALQFDIEARSIIIGTLKKRGNQKGRHFRTVPVPGVLIALLDEVLNIRALQENGQERCLYRFWP
ncbi:MAG: hypothetical protein AAGF44_02130, partial [Pseudomonadota bacterium]